MRLGVVSKYLIKIVLIAILLISGLRLLENHRLRGLRLIEYNYFYLTLVILIFFGGIGVLLALSRMKFSLVKNRNLIKVDILYLLIFGIPSLFFSLSYLWLVLGALLELSIGSKYLAEINYITIISSIIFGHTIISSLKLEEQ